MQPEEQIDRIIFAVMTTMGADIVDDIQYEVGILYPPASVPGEPPHRRSGNLHDSIYRIVEQSGPITTLTVVSGAIYSARLEGPMNRRFMGPAQDKWGPLIFQRFTEIFASASSSAFAVFI